MSKGQSLGQRFRDKVCQDGECWRWTAATNNCGYGVIWANGRLRQARHVAWELANGTVLPKSATLWNTCQNRWCVNPAHLRLAESDIMSIAEEPLANGILQRLQRRIERLEGELAEIRAMQPTGWRKAL